MKQIRGIREETLKGKDVCRKGATVEQGGRTAVGCSNVVAEDSGKINCLRVPVLKVKRALHPEPSLISGVIRVRGGENEERSEVEASERCKEHTHGKTRYRVRTGCRVCIHKRKSVKNTHTKNTREVRVKSAKRNEKERIAE